MFGPIVVFACTLGLLAAFDSEGNYSNGGDALFRQIGAYLAPDDAPPVREAP